MYSLSFSVHAKRKHKKAAVAILMSRELNFKSRRITRDEEREFIMTTRLLQQEDTIINVDSSNRVTKYVKQNGQN